MSGQHTEPRVAAGLAQDLYAITVAFDLREGARDAFLDLVRANAAASLARERECFRFDVLVSLAASGPQVMLYEIYRDRAAFTAHLATAHFLEFDAATRDMVMKKTLAEFSIRGGRD